MNETFNDRIRTRIKKSIQDAFSKAHEVHGVTGKVTPKVVDGSTTILAAKLATKQSAEPYYGEREIALFQKRADELMGAVQHNVTLHRQKSHSYYVGPLDKNYTAADVITEALQPESKKERKKAS